jgi:hypothetical protein
MPAIFCPACSSLLAAERGSGPRTHCPQCGEVVTLAGLGAEPDPLVPPAARLITETMLREWHDRFPFAPQPYIGLEGPHGF